MPLPTFNSSFDDDPGLETTGIKELSASEIASATPDVEAPKEAAVIPDKSSLSPDAKAKLKSARIAREMKVEEPVETSVSKSDDVEPVVLKQPDLDPVVAPASPAATESADDAPVEASEPQRDVAVVEGGYIPEINSKYFAVPGGEPIKETFEDRRIDRMKPGVADTIERIEDEEAFKREAEAHLGISQGEPKNDFPDWIVKPDVWPAFIVFPSKRDLQSIRMAEEDGKLDGEQKAKFNDHFQKLSILMQERARQMDAWIFAENEEIMKIERNDYKFLTPLIKKNLTDLKKDRAAFEDEQEAALKEGRAPSGKLTSDPFKDIKWAILLDPYASPDDPRFMDVARWGHGTAVMNDGGKLRVNDEGMSVPFGNDGSVMAGKMAVMEAIERGWTSINIAGSAEFVHGAREAAIQAGLGAKIVTQKGYLGKSVPEYIMPNPPKLASIRTANEEAQTAHEGFLNGDGKASSGGDPIEDADWTPVDEGEPRKAGGRKLAAPGVNLDAKAVDAQDPFTETDAEDAAALAALKGAEKSGGRTTSKDQALAVLDDSLGKASASKMPGSPDGADAGTNVRPEAEAEADAAVARAKGKGGPVLDMPGKPAEEDQTPTM